MCRRSYSPLACWVIKTQREREYLRQTFAWGLDLWTWRGCWRRGASWAAFCFLCFRMSVFAVGCLSVLNRLSAVEKKEREWERKIRTSVFIGDIFFARHIYTSWMHKSMKWIIHGSIIAVQSSFVCLNLQALPGGQTYIVLTI